MNATNNENAMDPNSNSVSQVSDNYQNVQQAASTHQAHPTILPLSEQKYRVCVCDFINNMLFFESRTKKYELQHDKSCELIAPKLSTRIDPKHFAT